MKHFLIPLFASVALIVAILFIAMSVNVDVSVKQNSAVAAEGVSYPSGVTRFQDGPINCYVLDRYFAMGNTNRLAGISCVSIK